MPIQEVRVCQLEGPGQEGEMLQQLIEEAGLKDLGKICSAEVYRFEEIAPQEADKLARRALTDPVTQRFAVNEPVLKGDGTVLERGFKPGVMDPVEDSLMQVARALGVSPIAVSHSTAFGFSGTLDSETLAQIGQLLTSQVEHVIQQAPETLIISGKPGSVEKVPISLLDACDLLQLQEERRLFLNQEEMLAIQAHFHALGREPTDIELETLAQTWSEHCCHKTFKADLVDEKGQRYQPLIERIRKTSEQFFGKVGVVSAFEDNAGGINFYQDKEGVDWVVVAKGETHNSPVAIEPYGGAGTKNGGLYRDIAGFGSGGKNLLTFLMNCFGPPDMKEEDIQPGCLHPLVHFRGNTQGEIDYGNRMGIPTHVTSFHFHTDSAPKPTSLGVVIGIIPESQSQKGVPQENDLIVSIGGRTGKDGIHGVTFASGSMTEKTATIDATAVQIGNAIEEKRMFDALLAARDEGLIRAVTDCGGGGYSSAIGEIGKDIGVEVDLDQVPLKYSGLAPWEIWISESQERMIAAISPEDLPRFKQICQDFEAPLAVIGRFTADNNLTLRFDGEIVGQLSMEFLHHGLPQSERRMVFVPHREDNATPDEPSTCHDWVDAFEKVLAHLNVCSKEKILRRYDNTVQATVVLAPFTGVNEDVPNDASVIAPILGEPFGVVTSFALKPMLNRIDPYHGAVWAVAMAAAKLTAVGGDRNKTALIDNFIWPIPDKKNLADLHYSTQGLCDAMQALQIPANSGKDSLSSRYRKKDGTVIDIPPVLNITMYGRISNVEQTVSCDIKSDQGSSLCLVGSLDTTNLGASIYFDTHHIVNSHAPRVDLDALPKTLDTLRQAIQTGKIKSSKAIGEGGLALALAQMCFGGDCGAKIDLSQIKTDRADFAFFSETPGCFVVEVDSSETAQELFKDTPFVVLGETTKEKQVVVEKGQTQLFKADVDKLKVVWQKPLEGVLF